MDHVRHNKQMRVKIAGRIGEVWPFTADILLRALVGHCESKGLYWTTFKIGGLPKSLNKMYEKGAGSSFCKPGEAGAFQDRRGRWRKKTNNTNLRLHPDVIDYRLAVSEAMAERCLDWKPTGVTAAIIFFESPYWLDGRRQVTQKDVDNRDKVLLDAIEIASETPDELHWELHLYKVLSKNHRTTVYLFDLGDIVEHYY